MQQSDEFTGVGTILKSKGVAGELVVEPTVDFPEELPKMSLFYVENDRGDMVPYRVSSSKLEHKSGRATFFVKFDKVNTRDQAEAMRGESICIPAEEASDLFHDEHPTEVVGYKVLDGDGTSRGEVLDVIENPAHWLVQVKTGAITALVPYVDAFITEIDDEAGTITIPNLDMFLEL